MLPDREDAQVFKPIVGAGTVDVIDMFPPLQPSSEMLFHDPAMLKNAASVYRESAIGADMRDTLRCGVAILRAKSLSRQSAGRKSETTATFLAAPTSSAILTSSGAEAGGQASIGLDVERGGAYLTVQRDHEIVYHTQKQAIAIAYSKAGKSRKK